MSSRETAKLVFALRAFGGRTRRGRNGLLEHAEHVMKSGYCEPPVWLEALRRRVAPPLLRRRAAHTAAQVAAAQHTLPGRSAEEAGVPRGASGSLITAALSPCVR